MALLPIVHALSNEVITVAAGQVFTCASLSRPRGIEAPVSLQLGEEPITGINLARSSDENLFPDLFH